MTLLSTSSNLSFCSGCADPSSYLFHISHHLAYILFGQTPPFYSSLTMGKSHPTSTQCTRFFYQSELLFNSSTDGCDENRHQWVNNCISMDADNPKHLGQRPTRVIILLRSRRAIPRTWVIITVHLKVQHKILCKEK